MTIKTTDNELIQSYLSGNDFAFNMLFKKHQSYLFNFIFSKIKDQDIAKDIFQETMIKIIVAIKSNKYKEESKFINFALRISNNLVIDHFRSQKKSYRVLNVQNEYLLINIPDENILLKQELIIKESYSKIEHLLIDLVPEQQEILLYRFTHEKTFKEIAFLTNVSIGTALGRFRYAIDNLRKEIKKKDIILFD